MHPAMIETLATERRSELLRQAEAYRRARSSARRRPRLTLASVVARAEKVGASLRRHSAAAVQPRTQTCCA